MEAYTVAQAAFGRNMVLVAVSFLLLITGLRVGWLLLLLNAGDGEEVKDKKLKLA